MPKSVRAIGPSSPPLLSAGFAQERCIGERKRHVKPLYTLLWVDDFAPGLAMYKAMFEALGFKVLTATSGSEALQLASASYFDAVITDYEMPEMKGDAVAAAIKSLKPGIPVLMFSGTILFPRKCRGVIDAFCDKAESRDKLLAAIHRLLHRKHPAALQPPVAAAASHHRHRTVA